MKQYYRDKPWMRSIFRSDEAIARMYAARDAWKLAHPAWNREYMRDYMRRRRAVNCG
jgi:hypothetical protein